MFILKKIEILNFRVFKELSIELMESSLIILKGENGLGKTSLLDSVEWCITGDIKRLHDSFSSRAKNRKDEILRKENKKGILKNKESTKDEEVKVILYLKYYDEIVKISRVRTEDTLEILENFEIEGDTISPELLAKLEELRNDPSIYNYNYCDLEKSYKFMNNSRNDLKEALKDFFVDRTKFEMLLQDIRGKKIYLEEKVLNKSVELEKYIKKEKDLKKERLESSIEKTTQEYPTYSAFESEIEDLKQGKAYTQILKNINGWGYWEINQKSRYLEKNEELKKKVEILNYLKNEYIKKHLIINLAIESEIYNEINRQKIYNELEDLKKKKSFICKGLNIEKKIFEEDKENISTYYKMKEKYDSLTLSIKKLDESIKLMGENNKLFIAFNKLILVNDQLVSEYIGKGNKKCPLCGSEELLFKLSSEELCGEAKAYLNREDSIKNKLINIREKNKNEKKDIEIQFEKFLNAVFEERIQILEMKKKEEESLWERTKIFFGILAKENIEIDKNIEYNLELLIEINLKLIEKDIKVNNVEIEIKNIIRIIDKTLLLDFEAKEYKKLQLCTSKLYSQELKYGEFNLEALTLKSHYLNNYINSNILMKIEIDIKNIQEKISLDSKKIDINKDKIVKLNEIIKVIEDDLKNIEKHELEEVGPYLYKIFCKLIKHTNISKFNFQRDRSQNHNTAGVSLLDGNGNNIINMFSNGQLGVFMVSYFIGNILRKGSENILSSFFVDDITSCFDDINILAFIDLLKYLLHDKNIGMKQLFFATCNKNIEILLKNRMESFGIEYKVIEFDGIGIIKDNEFPKPKGIIEE